ncbi:hypothetical protein GGI24_003311, partial [Coemansia furcata]
AHNFRAVAASDMHGAGTRIETIKITGGWATTGTTVDRYLLTGMTRTRASGPQVAHSGPFLEGSQHGVPPVG